MMNLKIENKWNIFLIVTFIICKYFFFELLIENKLLNKNLNIKKVKNYILNIILKLNRK